MQFYDLVIHSVDRLTSKAVNVQLKIPSELTSVFQFVPGQYITINYTTQEGQELRRSYSLSNLPGQETLQLGIKELDKGALFSAIANRQLKAGEVLRVSAPEGRFTYTAPEGSKVLALAAGSGITPVLSIARSLLETQERSSLLLLYGNTDASNVMYASVLQELQERFPERLTIKQIFSRKNDGDYFGRIDKAIIHQSTKASGGIDAFDLAYLCGPEAMIHESKAVLSASGMPEASIRFELFTASSEVNEVATEGAVEITVQLDNQTYTVHGDANEFVLDLLLEEGIDAPYSCQGGTCSSCICKITEGSAAMERNQVLTDKEIEQGYLLSCQAKATSAKLSIDFDEV
jgi:ring-1,2-phenylacetyl-CoA epoxidase subunit PaaE